ncbi:MAG: 4-hydroxy-3-methylbut-2-enyl diphosphate reductase [Bacteroidales bacterium]|nr:4-hydroxy-3-methylbut-2-enyl diphosphate reductase [Bacteroidales bacterium]
MELNIEIDRYSGFCNGVVRAVKRAEENLSNKENGLLYSLGAIVHNNSELERLAKIGLRSINSTQMQSLKNATVLIRAHGEPPKTYQIAKENNIKLIDCTCPVVLQLQKRIEQTDGQIVIFGKNGHAEVNGLVGKAEGRSSGSVVVVENVDDVNTLSSSAIDYSKPITIFSQTTKDPVEYRDVCQAIREKMHSPEQLTINDTICKQVVQRHSRLIEFAKNHSVILFVSGKESSNGHVLYELCRNHNSRSYQIESLQEIKKEWFTDGDSVGICGATSTPQWQLEQCATHLKENLK